jgi:hypothetical protein
MRIGPQLRSTEPGPGLPALPPASGQSSALLFTLHHCPTCPGKQDELCPSILVLSLAGWSRTPRRRPPSEGGRGGSLRARIFSPGSAVAADHHVGGAGARRTFVACLLPLPHYPYSSYTPFHPIHLPALYSKAPAATSRVATSWRPLEVAADRTDRPHCRTMQSAGEWGGVAWAEGEK